MTTTSLTDERTAVVTDLPDTQVPVRDGQRWFLPTRIRIKYVSTNGTEDGRPETAVAVEAYGHHLDKPGTGEERRPLTYSDDLPDWVVDYVAENRPTWAAQSEPAAF